MEHCPLCVPQGETVLWQNDDVRVIAAAGEPNQPAVCRVIWQRHAAEMTDLQASERDALMQQVYRVEQAMREVLRPDKINLASLGNVVPHLHWHIIARYRDDACFPAPVWAAPVRPDGSRVPADWIEQVAARLGKSGAAQV